MNGHLRSKAQEPYCGGVKRALRDLAVPLLSSPYLLSPTVCADEFLVHVKQRCRRMRIVGNPPGRIGHNRSSGHLHAVFRAGLVSEPLQSAAPSLGIGVQLFGFVAHRPPQARSVRSLTQTRHDLIYRWLQSPNLLWLCSPERRVSRRRSTLWRA